MERLNNDELYDNIRVFVLKLDNIIWGLKHLKYFTIDFGDIQISVSKDYVSVFNTIKNYELFAFNGIVDFHVTNTDCLISLCYNTNFYNSVKEKEFIINHIGFNQM